MSCDAPRQSRRLQPSWKSLLGKLPCRLQSDLHGWHPLRSPSLLGFFVGNPVSYAGPPSTLLRSNGKHSCLRRCNPNHFPLPFATNTRLLLQLRLRGALLPLLLALLVSSSLQLWSRRVNLRPYETGPRVSANLGPLMSQLDGNYDGETTHQLPESFHIR